MKYLTKKSFADLDVEIFLKYDVLMTTVDFYLLQDAYDSHVFQHHFAGSFSQICQNSWSIHHLAEIHAALFTIDSHA